ncbi:hypothetical protein BDZ94DRAFT_1326103 [Collybia nuda]|uniref:Uncharacterized protein n=1 Tax=Collybia nuda TaxID=64659 RepID=A0A9P6CE36_9AGAR|nr:hypothetical protein BDZ94DRAFT_1326103 [Collybia nuda]
MNQRYIFDNESNYYNATISGADNASGSYTLTSVVRPANGVPNTTILQSPWGEEGVIHWRDREIEVDGVRHPIDTIKQREGGPRSLTYLWALGKSQWRSKYMSDSRSWKVWSGRDNPPSDTVVIEFKPYRSKTFGKADAAELRISVSDKDAIFVILFLIYLQIIEGPRFSFMDRMLGDLFASSMSSGSL